jgi:hypothetical protein
MPSLIQQISKQHPNGVHTIFVVGAARGGNLQDWRKLGSKRLVLTEAHPELATKLARCIDTTRGEEVWPLAITASDQEQAVLHTCNNPRFSSLHRPCELDSYFPHLKMIGEAVVSARKFGIALQQSVPAKGTDNLLVLAAPGQTTELIRSTPPERLQAFDWIIVHADAVPLYEGDNMEACLASLKAAGFDYVQEDTDTIHPERIVLLKRNDTRVRIGQLEDQEKQLTRDRASLIAQHKMELDKATATLAEREKLASDCHAQLQALMQERDALSNAAAQHKIELAKATAELATQSKLAADRDVLLKKVSLQNQERGSRITALDKQHTELQQRQVWLNEEMLKAEAEIEFIKEIFLKDSARK